MKLEIIGLLFSVVVAGDCESVALAAYEIQFDRQFKTQSDSEPVTLDEKLIQMDKSRMPIEQHPAWKQRRVREFATEWYERCLNSR